MFIPTLMYVHAMVLTRTISVSKVYQVHDLKKAFLKHKNRKEVVTYLYNRFSHSHELIKESRSI